jgi:hypothetical protein
MKLRKTAMGLAFDELTRRLVSFPSIPTYCHPKSEICGEYVKGRGINLFNEVGRRNLEGVVAERKNVLLCRSLAICHQVQQFFISVEEQ